MCVLSVPFLVALAVLASATLAQEPQPPVRIVPKTPSAQQSGAQTPPANPLSTHTLDAEDLGAFFDGIIPLQLERSDCRSVGAGDARRQSAAAKGLWLR